MADKRLTAQDLENRIRRQTEAKLKRARAAGTLHEVELAEGLVAKVVTASKHHVPGWVEVPDPPGPPPIYDRRAILAALEAGMSDSAAHREFGCSRRFVGKIRAILAALDDAGMSDSAVAREVGCSCRLVGDIRKARAQVGPKGKQ
jgi:hypothetical protein